MKPRPILLPVLFLLLCLQGYGQDQPKKLLKNYRVLTSTLKTYLKSGSIASFDKAACNTLLAQKPDQFEFGFEFEGKTWVLMLEKNNPFSKGFHVISASSKDQPVPYKSEIAHYKGKVKGAGKSVVALTVLPDRIAVVISDASVGNINIASLKNKTNPNSNEHIIYRDTDLLIPNEANCSTQDDKDSKNDFINNYAELAPNSTTVNAEPIDLYFEADHAIYTNNGSNISNVVNYVTTLFNVVNVIFENDSINVRINVIKVWDVADPYVSLTNAGSVLNQFAQNMSPWFPGDFAHFLSQRSLGGGVAYLNSVCANNFFKTAVSGNLSNSFEVFPTYSWSVEVITHELGHNFGSPHTQSCSWPGGAIDNCYFTEGGCPPGPEPVNGGTIMSYCHQTSFGINFSHGFGPLPAALIRNIMRNNPCINPGVYFEAASTFVREDSANTANLCIPYKLFTTRVRLAYGSTQPASISLQILPSSNVEIGPNRDVEFISPSSFTLDANNLSQTLEFKVYNDGITENQENLTLGIQLNSNGGNSVVASSNNTYSLNIISDDLNPDSTTGILLRLENFEGQPPFGSFGVQKIIAGHASPNRWVVGNSGDADFPGKSLFISNNGSSAAYSGSIPSDSTIVRYEIGYSFYPTYYRDLKLSILYKCNGDILGTPQGIPNIFRDYGSIYYSLDTGNTWLLAKSDLAGVGRKTKLEFDLPTPTPVSEGIGLGFEWRNNSSVVGNPPIIIDSFVLTGTGAAMPQFQNSTNNYRELYLGPYQTIHFFDRASTPSRPFILATIQNNSAFDFGCTKVEALRVGWGVSQAWGEFDNEKISNKQFRITPTNTNPSAPYTVKLYYTNFQVEGWLAGTGNELADLQIAKSEQDISIYNENAQPVFSSNRTIEDFGGSKNKVISADFTGFGYFALAKPVSPPSCKIGTNQFVSSLTGSSYQWEVNTGNGYIEISDAGIYSGTNTPTLQITNPPGTYYGYAYRCKVNTSFGVQYSNELLLKFQAKWLGTVSSAWENPLNWSCGDLPDEYTDVYIKSGTPFTAELGSSVTVRSLNLPANSNLVIKNGNIITVKY